MNIKSSSMKLNALPSPSDLKDKRVLLRVDFNVPIKNGVIEDDTRMTAALPTIQKLIKAGAKVILMSHLGRPQEEGKKGLSIDPVAKRLGELLKKPVQKLDDCVGTKVEKAVAAMKPGEIIMLENIRFYAEEEKNDPALCKELAKLADLFVSDCFGVAHRKHASIYGIAKLLPSYAGLLMEKEVTTLSKLMEKPVAPLTLIMGGAKIETKIGLMKNFLARADNFLVGGGLANTFLAAGGNHVAKSLYEKEKVNVAQEIMLSAESLETNFVLPKDAVAASEAEEKAQTLQIPVEDIVGNMRILDIGNRTIDQFIAVIEQSKTIVWNGPMGLFEKTPFQGGTKAIAHAIANKKEDDPSATTIIGGGDTIEALKKFNIPLESFTHVSTGGGAMLQFLEGTSLPGVEVLCKK